jgi:hypothetical protein
MRAFCITLTPCTVAQLGFLSIIASILFLSLSLFVGYSYQFCSPFDVLRIVHEFRFNGLGSSLETDGVLQ